MFTWLGDYGPIWKWRYRVPDAAPTGWSRDYRPAGPEARRSRNTPRHARHRRQLLVFVKPGMDERESVIEIGRRHSTTARKRRDPVARERFGPGLKLDPERVQGIHPSSLVVASSSPERARVSPDEAA